MLYLLHNYTLGTSEDGGDLIVVVGGYILMSRHLNSAGNC